MSRNANPRHRKKRGRKTKLAEAAIFLFANFTLKCYWFYRATFTF